MARDIVPVEETLLVQVRGIFPAAPRRSIARLREIGFSNQEILQAAELARMNGSSLSAIVTWVNVDGMTLTEIEAAFLNQEDVAWASEWCVSIRIINRLRQACDLQTEDCLEMMLETFADIAATFSPRVPFNRFMHRVEEAYGGDLLRAFQDAENASLFRRVLLGKADRVHMAVRQVAGERLTQEEIRHAKRLGIQSDLCLPDVDDSEDIWDAMGNIVEEAVRDE